MRKLICFLLLATFSFAAFAVSAHWADRAYNWFIEKGVVSEGEFSDIDAPATRGQLVKLVVGLLGDNGSTAKPFTDVPEDDPYYKCSLAARAGGYITGYEDGSLRPLEPITRQDACVILGRAFKIQESAGYVFSDSKNIADYAISYVMGMAKAEILRGYPDGSFRPRDNITIGELLTASKAAFEKTQSITPDTPKTETPKTQINIGGGVRHIIKNPEFEVTKGDRENNDQPVTLKIEQKSDDKVEYSISRMSKPNQSTGEMTFDKIEGKEKEITKNGRYVVQGVNKDGGKTYKTVDITEIFVCDSNREVSEIFEKFHYDGSPFDIIRDYNDDLSTVYLSYCFRNNELTGINAFYGDRVSFEGIEPVFMNDAIEKEIEKANPTNAFYCVKVPNGSYNYYVKDSFGNCAVLPIDINEDPLPKFNLTVLPREDYEPVTVKFEHEGDIVEKGYTLYYHLFDKWNISYNTYFDFPASIKYPELATTDGLHNVDGDTVTLTRSGYYCFYVKTQNGRIIATELKVDIQPPKIKNTAVEDIGDGKYKITFDIETNPGSTIEHLSYGTKKAKDPAMGGGGYYDNWRSFDYLTKDATVIDTNERSFIVDKENFKQNNNQYYLYLNTKDSYGNMDSVRVELDV